MEEIPKKNLITKLLELLLTSVHIFGWKQIATKINPMQ